ncbi:MAG: hypothetical protein K2V71_08920 [Methylotenera sp.]|nr:hypothetical protein [Methylotenera sp.]
MHEFTVKENKIIKENARYFLQLQAISKMDIEEKEAHKLKIKELKLNFKTIALINSEHPND